MNRITCSVQFLYYNEIHLILKIFGIISIILFILSITLIVMLNKKNKEIEKELNKIDILTKEKNKKSPNKKD